MQEKLEKMCSYFYFEDERKFQEYVLCRDKAWSWKITIFILPSNWSRMTISLSNNLGTQLKWVLFFTPEGRLLQVLSIIAQELETWN